MILSNFQKKNLHEIENILGRRGLPKAIMIKMKFRLHGVKTDAKEGITSNNRKIGVNGVALVNRF